VQTSELSGNDRAVGQDGGADVVADASHATPPMRTATAEAGRVLLGYVGMDGQPEKGQVALLRDGANFIAHGPNGDYALGDARTPEQARQRVQQLLRHDAISDRYPMQARDALTPGEKAQSKHGLADELTRFESQVNRFASEYGERAEGKAGIQKAMDFGRQIFNGGYGDDQFKNIGQTQEGLKQLRDDVQAGRLDAGQAQQQLQALQQKFEVTASDVSHAQTKNAEMGQLVHDTTRAVVVGGAGFVAGSAGFAAGMGVGSVPGAVVAGAAGATAAANAFDAVSKGAQELDKKLGNGAKDGQPGFAPELNTKGSLAGLASNALAGERISGKDVLNTAVTSTLDAAGGAWAGKIIHSTHGAFAAAHVTAQQAARQSGLGAAQSATVQATNTALAGEVAKVGASHAVGQSGTELLIKNAGTMADPSLNAQQRNEQVLANTKDSALQLPGRVVFGAAGSAAAGIKPANVLADAATQWGIPSTAAAGQAFVGNGLTGQGWRLDDKDLVQASLFGASGAARNFALRTPGGTRAQRPVSQTDDAPQLALPPATTPTTPFTGGKPVTPPALPPSTAQTPASTAAPQEKPGVLTRYEGPRQDPFEPKTIVEAVERVRPPTGQLVVRQQNGLPTLDLKNTDLSARTELRSELQQVQRNNANVQLDLGGSDLRGQNLSQLDLSRADFSGANMTGADLSGSNLGVSSLRNARLQFADLSDTSFHGSAKGANLQNANLAGGNFEDAALTSATLWRANLDQAQLYGADLTGADLGSASLRDANLAQAVLRGTDLRGADLSNASLTGADLSPSVKGTKTDLRGADLSNVQLNRADVSNVIFGDTNLEGAKLKDAKLDGSDFASTPMRKVPDLEEMRTLAKQEITPELIDHMAQQGLTYKDTGVMVLVRHGRTNHNEVPGGFFSGNKEGPHGAQLTPAAREEASRLNLEMRQIAPQISEVFVSPVDRARDTMQLATKDLEDVLPRAQVVEDMRERGIGGMFGLPKPAPGAKKKVSEVFGGITIGKAADGTLGYDINPLGRDYVPSNDVFPGGSRRNRPEGTDGKAESWNLMLDRAQGVLDEKFLPVLAEGKNALGFTHQYFIGMEDAALFKPAPGATGEDTISRDPVLTGHGIPNTAPQYWPVHVFEDQDGGLHSVPSGVGQGQLAAPQDLRGGSGGLPPLGGNDPSTGGGPKTPPTPNGTPPLPTEYGFDWPSREQGTANIGQAARFPVDSDVKLSFMDTAPLQIDLTKKAFGLGTDALIDRTIAEPLRTHVTGPAADKTLDAYLRFADTRAGQAVVGATTQSRDAVQALTSEGTLLGDTSRWLYSQTVANEPLWNNVDKAAKGGQAVVAGGLASTLAALAYGQQTGTLETGRFRTGGDLPPDQMEIVKAINIPPGMDVNYWKVQGSTTVEVDGKSHEVPTRAFVALAEGRNAVLLPALGPGQPGAQPWVGYDRESKKGVAASSSVAAGWWGLAGFSAGTPNLNVNHRSDLQVGRVLVNALSGQTGINPDTGKAASSLQSILIADPLSTFNASTINAGPLAVVVNRVRDPQSERLAVGLPKSEATFSRDSHASSVFPAFPVVGAGTWDPNAGDIQLIGDLLSRRPRQNESPAPRSTEQPSSRADDAGSGVDALSGDIEALKQSLAGNDIAAARLQLGEIEAKAGRIAQSGGDDAPLADAYAVVARQLVRDKQAQLSGDAGRDIKQMMSRGDPEIDPPRGVSNFPPARSTDWNLTDLPAEQVRDAIAKWETNSYPVSDASFEHPADPLFATFFRGLEGLGTRSLSMAEMRVLIESDVGWRGRMQGQPFALVGDPEASRGVDSMHEWHRAFTGFRTVPSSLIASVQAGMGGEQGLFARLTDEFEDIPDNLSSSEVRRFMSKQSYSAKDLMTGSDLTDQVWDTLKTELVATQDTAASLNKLVTSGYVADPRRSGLLQPSFDAIAASEPGSMQRQRAAESIIDQLRPMEEKLKEVSIPAATAEIQLAQTLEQYIKRNRLNVVTPTDRIDGVALYALYRELLAGGQLISNEQVQSQLESLGVPTTNDMRAMRLEDDAAPLPTDQASSRVDDSGSGVDALPGDVEALKQSLAGNDIKAARTQLGEIEAKAGRIAQDGSDDAPLANAYAVVARQLVRDKEAQMSVDAGRNIELMATPGDNGEPRADMAWNNPMWDGSPSADRSAELRSVKQLLASRGVPEQNEYTAHLFLGDIREDGLAERTRFLEEGAVPGNVADGTYSMADFMTRTSSLAAYIEYLAQDEAAFNRAGNKELLPSMRFDALVDASDNGGVLTPAQFESIAQEENPHARNVMMERALHNLEDNMMRDLAGSHLREEWPIYGPSVEYLSDPANRQKLGVDIKPRTLEQWEFVSVALETRALVERQLQSQSEQGPLTPEFVVGATSFLHEQIELMRERQPTRTNFYSYQTEFYRTIQLFEGLISRIEDQARNQ
jgi:uncharacterized protein YjbI with pentapeptide repeats/bisphosphoglycerate-dependent phosphoglycerate mutase